MAHSSLKRKQQSWLLVTMILALASCCCVRAFSLPNRLVVSSRAMTTVLHQAMSRENEIRRKILQLKKAGKLKKQTQRSESSLAEYKSKIRSKLGDQKSKYLGIIQNDDDDEDEALLLELEQDDESEETSREVRLGVLQQDEEQDATITPSGLTDAKRKENILDPSLFETPDDEEEEEEEDELSEDELVEMVAMRLQEKQAQAQKEKEARILADAKERMKKLQSEVTQQKDERPPESEEQTPLKKTTTGVGGSWNQNSTAKEEMYQPSKSGSWGAFPRPRDISKAYGGGRRIDPGMSNEEAKRKSEEETRERLRRYREKVGIEVQSEKDHAEEIEEALNIAMYAMQRGVYATAVSALEKVTRHCSTNSKVGGKVFLELAMAYEAVGRTQEAIAVYTTLTKCRIEDIKYNAKRLLYGIEAMQFMRNEARSKEFSRKKIRNTFIDTTGLANIADNFDDVYQTAYIDLDSGFYKRLTESVVRSNREARQILLKATGRGEVDRMRVVQALRSLSRNFETALEAELERNKPAPEPVAVMDGKPIVQSTTKAQNELAFMISMTDEFVLASPQQMIENLQGEWRLQLLADKRGDGVKYFNSTLVWQQLDTEDMTYSSCGPSGFLTVSQKGSVDFEAKRRILRRNDVELSGGVWPGFLGGGGGPTKAVTSPHQIVTVDSVLLITRCAPTSKKTPNNAEKDHFAVWRRVEPGTYSSLSS